MVSDVCVHASDHIILLALRLLAVCVLMCQNTKKEFYKKFLYEPLPVEVNSVFMFTVHTVGDA